MGACVRNVTRNTMTRARAKARAMTQQVPMSGRAAPCSNGDWVPAVLTSETMVSVMVTRKGLSADEFSHSCER